MKITLAHFLVNEQLPQFFVACFHAFHLSEVCRINLIYIVAQAGLLFNTVSYTSGEYDRFAGIVQHLSARQKQLNLRAVRATMPTPHSEGKVNGGQTMNYRVNPFQDYELITIDEGRLCLTRPAGSPRFEYQSKNIHGKIMMKVNSVLLAGRRYFPLLLVRFPLKRSSY